AAIDKEVAEVTSLLKAKGVLNKTIIIVTSDHGQEFNDNHLNYWGHASNFTPVQTQVPFIVHWPGQTPRVFSYRTSHYDVVPTLMQSVLGCLNPPSDYSIGYSLFDPTPRPYIIVGSYIYSG